MLGKSIRSVTEQMTAILEAVKPLANDYEKRSAYKNELSELLYDVVDEENLSSFDPLIDAVSRSMGEEQVLLLRYILQHKTEYSYSSGYYRRPFKTKNLRAHIRDIRNLVFDLLSSFVDNKSLLKQWDPKPGVYYSSQIVFHYAIAYRLDRGDPEALELIKEMVYGDNNTAVLTRNVIMGMVTSHRPEVYRMLGELLIAARLQEGLRQSIVESMDEGTTEAFLYLFNIIMEHDLTRYSSVVRAMDVWTGLYLEAANTRVVRQCFHYAHQCLADEQLRKQWAESRDASQLYMSLWASAYHEENTMATAVESIMRDGETYQKITALHLLRQSHNQQLRWSIAHRHLDQSVRELQYLVILNYAYRYSTEWRQDGHRHVTVERTPMLEDKAERQQQFALLKRMLLELPNGESSYRSKVFEWIEYIFTPDDVLRKLMYLTGYDLDASFIHDLILLKDRFSHDLRQELLDYFVLDMEDPVQRVFVFTSLSDKSLSVRKVALQKISRLELSAAEIERVHELLKLKTSDIRKSVIQIMLTIPEDRLGEVIDTLLASGQAMQRLGGLELLCELREAQDKQALYDRLQDKASMITSPSEVEKPLLERLHQSTSYQLLNGFGLYDPSKELAMLGWPQFAMDEGSPHFTLSADKVITFLQGLSDLVGEYREYEYESNYSTSKEAYLVGHRLEMLVYRTGDDITIEDYPLSEVWKSYLELSGFSNQEILQLQLYVQFQKIYEYLSGSDRLRDYEKKWLAVFSSAEGRAMLEAHFPVDTILEVYKSKEQMPYPTQMRKLIEAFIEGVDKAEQWAFAGSLLKKIALDAPRIKEGTARSKLMSRLSWLNWARSSVHDDHSFTAYFTLLMNMYLIADRQAFEPSTEEWVRAYELDLVDEETLLRQFTSSDNGPRHMNKLTEQRWSYVQKHPKIKPILEKIIPRLLEIELQRGELPTEVTDHVRRIHYFEGTRYFVQLLQCMGSANFVRGYINMHATYMSKQDAFSYLLKVCHAREDEDENTLRELLQQAKLSERRVLEGAMYAPQWLDKVAAIFDWQGLKRAAWYFHAHVNEVFSAEKETMVARYSPIRPEEFNDGAFDIQWFQEAYAELGEERFAVLYDCAKYISAGANHRRSQLFADAVLGRLQLDELEHSIVSKRNKDHLLCYSLVPLQEDRTQDVSRRYERIQQFLKESKSFGAQRRASESKAVMISLDNLARNAGYSDAVRLRWDVESRKVDQLSAYFQPQPLDEETSLSISITDEGKPELQVYRKDKLQKSIPSKYKNHTTVVEFKEATAELREQYRRGKAELERAMESGSTFRPDELLSLSASPLFAPLVNTLAFRSESSLGFYRDGFLVDPEGARYPLHAEEEVWIAHPVHLYESGRWSAYQRYVFDQRIVQPFKQIFRELYVLNADEVAMGTRSMRYAGYQVQPKKTAALLKTRHWTVSYEEGLQKVLHKENLIARIYALADWFSPSDIEYPTLEYVEFFDRHTGKHVHLIDVPKIIFSEVMRDIDLAVSVAHAGGVDPEASLTTIELRQAIVAESIRLMRLTNVRVDGNYALIKGSLGEYSVHLGSGMAYKQARGALHIIPVHAQHRGRLFLPFLDENPKTAEILSKIVVLAEDTKIKDPSILTQIV